MRHLSHELFNKAFSLCANGDLPMLNTLLEDAITYNCGLGILGLINNNMAHIHSLSVGMLSRLLSVCHRLCILADYTALCFRTKEVKEQLRSAIDVLLHHPKAMESLGQFASSFEPALKKLGVDKYALDIFKPSAALEGPPYLPMVMQIFSLVMKKKDFTLLEHPGLKQLLNLLMTREMYGDNQQTDLYAAMGMVIEITRWATVNMAKI